MTILGNELINPHQSKLSEFFKEKEKLKLTKFEGDLVRISREKTVKQIFNELGVSSVRELPSEMMELESDNQLLLRESNRIFGQIVAVETSIYEMSRQQNSRTRRTSSRKGEMREKKEAMSGHLDEIRGNRQEMNEFMLGCKAVITSIRGTQGKQLESHDFLNDKDEVVYYMAELEKYFEKSYLERA